MTLDDRRHWKNNTVTALFSIIATLLILFFTRSLDRGDNMESLLNNKADYTYVDKRDDAISRQCQENLTELKKSQNEKLDLIIKLIETKK